MMMTRTVLICWTISDLKRGDVVLSKISGNITYEYKMELRNAPFFHLLELLLMEPALKVEERLNCGVVG